MAVATQKIVIHADDKTGAAIASAIRNSKKLEKQVSSTGKAMRNTTRQSRAQLGQVGHQIQDIAVMYQMGMNPMLILGQQGSQLAGIFGTSGALFGGVVAIAAVVGQQLAPALMHQMLPSSLRKRMRRLPVSWTRWKTGSLRSQIKSRS